MIIGIGIDLIEIGRMAQTLERHGDRFVAHIFTEKELASAPKHPAARIAYFAGRWAAKEAFSKALGTGIGKQCAWTDIEVDNDSEGKPMIRLCGSAAQTAGERGAGTIFLSISHEKHYACAHVVIEAP